MYGTIARLRLKPGAQEDMQRLGGERPTEIDGFVFQHVYQTDADPNVMFLVVAFDSKEAYLRNAQSPEQAGRYERFRAMLEADPEWHDGEIVDSFPR